MDKLGFLLLILGCAGMDSPNQIIPAIIASTGLLIIVVSVLKEKGLVPYRPKQWTRPIKKYYIMIVTRGIGEIKE